MPFYTSGIQLEVTQSQISAIELFALLGGMIYLVDVIFKNTAAPIAKILYDSDLIEQIYKIAD